MSHPMDLSGYTRAMEDSCSCIVTHATRESRSLRCAQQFPKWYLPKAWARELKLVPPPHSQESTCPQLCIRMCMRPLLCPQCLFQLPSTILLWLLSKWDEQQLVAANLNGALELRLEASVYIYIPHPCLGP